MFKTTDLIIEFFISGVLILTSLFLLTFSLFPDVIRTLVANALRAPTGAQFMIALVLLGISYAIGLILECCAREAFDWKLHNKIKKKSMEEHFKEYSRDVRVSPILRRPVNSQDPDPHLTKEMRFYIMTKDGRLRSEIEAHINRLRIIRVLFVFLLITFFAVLIIMMRDLFPGKSNVLVYSLIFIFFLGLINYLSIKNRMKRFCRAINLGYFALLEEEFQNHIK